MPPNPSSSSGYPPGPADSLVVSGTAAAPAAGVIISIAAPPAGIYVINGSFGISGAVEILPKNVRIVANGGGVLDLPSGLGVTTLIPFTIPQITLNGATAVTFNAIANATAATVYTAHLALTRLA